MKPLLRNVVFTYLQAITALYFTPNLTCTTQTSLLSVTVVVFRGLIEERDTRVTSRLINFRRLAKRPHALQSQLTFVVTAPVVDNRTPWYAVSNIHYS